jgi:uncharacterized cupredoxin-like copper-binding protein
VSGCGGGNDESARSIPQTTSTGAAAQAQDVLQLQTAPGGALKFNHKILKATGPVVEIVMQNASEVPHNVAIKGNGVDVKGPVVTGADMPSTVRATLKPGTYTFYCSVDGHEAAGMKGQLIVGAPE